jgi:RNA polymerase sigma-70 factor (ECF subfamily)
VLVARVRGGDEHAFEQLYLRYREPITRMVANIVRDSLATPDLVQEIFTKAFFGLAREANDRGQIQAGAFRPTLPFRPWLYRIATNHCLDYLRKVGRQPFRVAIEEEANGDGTGAVLPDARHSDALNQLVSRDLVSKLLLALKPRDRVLLVMKEIEDLSLYDISEITGMTVTAIKVGLFRARRRMLERYNNVVGSARERSRHAELR